MADKEIGDQGCGVRHKGSLVIARLLGQPEEIPRVFEGFGELAIDQLSQTNTPQDRSFLANSPVICAKFECSTVGLIDIRIGPPCVRCVCHRKVGLQRDFSLVPPP